MLNKKDKVSYLVQIVNGVIPLLIIFFLTRRGGLGFIGEYFLALSVIGVTQVVVDYGFNQSGLRSFAGLIERRAAAADIWSLFISIVAAKVLIAALLVAGVIVYTLIAAPVNAISVLSCVAAGVILSVTNAAPVVFALKKSIRLSLVTFVARVLFMLPLFMIEPSLLVALVLTLVPVLIANIYSLVVASECIDVRGRELKIKLNVIGLLCESRSIFLNSILASLITTAWPLVLSHSLTHAELGAYGIADKIVRGLMTFVTPLQAFVLASNCLISFFEIAGFVLRHRLYRILLLVVLFAPVALMVFPDTLLRLFLGKEVIDYRMVLSIYGVGFMFYFCNFILYTYLIVAKREMLYSPIALGSFGFSVVMAYIFGLNIYAPLISESLVALMLMLATFKYHTTGDIAK